MWEHFHQIFVNDLQEKIVSCNECKRLLGFTSINRTNNLKTKIKLSVVQACAEFSALDDRASDTMKENSFQNLAQVLFDAGRALTKSSIQVQAILPNPTTAIN
ncbi:unnamed protein product [Rotaria sp. Silwood1]|nr:unnamed protein product [Rotaria sp. Silwood1]